MGLSIYVKLFPESDSENRLKIWPLVSEKKEKTEMKNDEKPQFFLQYSVSHPFS